MSTRRRIRPRPARCSILRNLSICAGGGRFGAGAQFTLHRHQKAHVRFLNHRIGGEFARGEIAGDPGPAGQAPRANTGCRRTRCPCDWRWVRAARAARRAASSARLDHDPDVPGKHEFPVDALLQILAAEICGLQHHARQSCARRLTACKATDSVAKSGADPVRRSTTSRFNESTAGGVPCNPLVDARSRRPGPCMPAPRRVILRCNCVQIVAQRAARHRLPMAVRGQAFDLFLDPRQADALAEVEIRPGRIAYLARATPCATSTRSSAQCSASSDAMRAASCSGTCCSMSCERSTLNRACSVTLSTSAELAEQFRHLARRSATPRARYPGRCAGSRAASRSCAAAAAWFETSPCTARPPGCGCRAPSICAQISRAANTSRAML